MDEDFYTEEDGIDYLARYNPLRKSSQEQEWRPRKTKANRLPKKTQSQIIAEIAEPAGLEGGFHITYKPALYEEVWLLESLRSFYDEHLIVDVLAQIKGGKEASVYRCLAEPSLGLGLVAAKVYRPRRFRNLSNDKMYRQGRPILTGEGRAVKRTDHRVMRAIGKKTAFGMEVEHTSWLLYEYTTLKRLYEAGADVPQPLAVSENTILMSYHGDERRAAPTLSEIRLEKAEAEALLEQVLRNIRLMLSHDLVHGDLSAYNILYWQGQITLIDFPQVTNSRTNPDAHFILQRDLTRICDYFARQGVVRDPERLTQEYWEQYVGQDVADFTPPDDADL